MNKDNFGNSYISPKIQQWIEQFQDEVKKLLSPLGDLSVENKRAILRRYDAATEGNFLAWMAATIISARHPLSKFAAEENMWVEIEDDHPTMLHEFVKSADALPGKEDFEKVSKSVLRIRSIVSKKSGLQCIALMAMLEGGSVSFAPYLGEIAKSLGSQNLKYSNVHGEADVLHSAQFLSALTKEIEENYGSEDDIDALVSEMQKAVMQWLTEIFSIT